jgi:hypothetical protein
MKPGDRLDTLADMLFSLTRGRPHVFAILPFNSSAPIFALIRGVVEDGGQLVCLHAGMVKASGLDLLTKIHFLIARSELVVAEISDPARPNVSYELGYAAALNKPNILLLQKGQQAPADLRGIEVISYSTDLEDEDLHWRLKQTLISRLSKGNALVRDMLQPEAGPPAYVLCSPWYLASGSEQDHKLYDERTFGDYLGVVGLLSAFGTFFSEQRDYELISGQYYSDDLLDQPLSLYLIGSPRVNKATGKMLPRVQAHFEPKWSLRPAEPAESERGPAGALSRRRRRYQVVPANGSGGVGRKWRA